MGDIENQNTSATYAASAATATTAATAARGGRSRHFLSKKRHFLSENLHNKNGTFISILFMLIALKRLESPTVFDTHSVSMTVCVISVCLYFIMIMTRMKFETNVKTVQFTCFLDHAILFAGALTPASQISVLLPYEPLWFLGFVCLLFCSVLARYIYKSIYSSDKCSG